MAAKKPRVRTAKGTVTAAARKKYGNPDGSFPIGDRASALSAINLRGHSSKPSRELNRASRWAGKHNDPVVKAAVKRARAKK